jgi:YggT family protein
MNRLAEFCALARGGRAILNLPHNRQEPMNAIYTLVYLVGQVLIWMLIIWAVLGWLITFNVVNPRNPFVSSVMRSLEGLFTPLLRPIRRILPTAGGLDLSPLVLIILIYVIQALLLKDILPLLM